MLNEGDQAPDFSLADDTGATVSLADLRGSRVVLYFYPKDDTPGCTKQACELRDSWSEIQATGVRVYGVSPDSVASHARFRAKFDLPYGLLADEGHAVADAFGVWAEKSMYGKTYWGNVRSTFLIGEDGTIERIWRDVKPVGHSALILEAVAA
jgi:thioredoxin-dependent peroxiredoxin